MSKAKKTPPGKNKKSSARKKSPATKPHTSPPKPHTSFPIVAIGASAGGLEAFSALLQNLSDDLGMAYVFIQHLHPEHVSNLPELLERKTDMPVHAIENEMTIKPNHVYVIPSNKFIKLDGSALNLIAREPSKKGYYPVDHFFLQLADQLQDRAIGVILSGTASDGTIGLKSIKAAGGITFAQDTTAKYFDMPNSAVESGSVDFVMPPERIARKLAALTKTPMDSSQVDNLPDGEIKKILDIIHHRLKVDFAQYKSPTIKRRIIRRMAFNQYKRLGDYSRYLRTNIDEVKSLYQDLLIHVTTFFRDSAFYQLLISGIIPQLFKQQEDREPIRIWVPGCSSGEETYSIAICLFEYMNKKNLNTPIQIFSTDLDEMSIEKARSGIYTKASLQNVSPERLQRFFTPVDGKYQINKAIRDICIFAPHNLLKDPPFSRMDLISCQNVLIYLEQAAQRRVLETFHYALKSSGYLLLGKSESVGVSSDLFSASHKSSKLFQKKETPFHLTKEFEYTPAKAKPRIPAREIPVPLMKAPMESELEKQTDKLLLSKFVPASVIVNSDMDILHFRGNVSRYLSPSSGKASLNLLKMIREELTYDVRTLMLKLKKDERMVRKENIDLPVNGSSITITIEAMPVNGEASRGSKYYLVLFRETSKIKNIEVDRKGKPSDARDKKITQLEKQLKEEREHLKAVSEDAEATREELQSANEEVLSSNEELQSVNEELETSKEELQSTNEELVTINEELMRGNADLKDARDFADAIVRTIKQPILVLNANLRIHFANRSFYEFFKLNIDQTEGMYVYELSERELNFPQLRHQLEKLIRTDVSFEQFEAEHLFPRIGRKFLSLNARKLMQKSGKEFLILLMLEDITQQKLSEKAVTMTEEKFTHLIQNLSDIITIFDKYGKIMYMSPSVFFTLGYMPQERVGTNIYEKDIVHPDDREKKQKMLRESLGKPSEAVTAEFRLKHKKGHYVYIEATCQNLLEVPSVNGLVATYRDITERKQLDAEKEQFIAVASHELRTPVTSIKLFSEVLKEKGEESEDAELKEMTVKMNEQVNRLTTLIVELLDISKITSGKFELKEEKFDLNRLIRETVEQVNTTTAHNFKLTLHGSIRVSGDRMRIGQVVMNLVSNAVKFSPDAKPIMVSTSLNDNKAMVAVRDGGAGISKEHQKKIFDKFYRVQSSKNSTSPGIGLGLFISSEIISLHGGQIWVDSDGKNGSTFYFTLPLAKGK